MRFFSFVLVAVWSLGCPSPSSEPDASFDAGAVAVLDAGHVDAGRLEVQWGRCSLHSEGGPLNAECASVPVPLDADQPDGSTIEIFVKRYRPDGGAGLRALWMLQGGPGASGYAYESLSESMATRFPDVDYYFPDHRGTGRSSRLSCPDEERPGSEEGAAITGNEWASCRASVLRRYGSELQHYDVTNAANDLGLLISATRRPDQPVFVLGISYGTYWLHRYLQLFPAQADGAIFDSIAPPGTSLFRQDEDANEAMRDFMGACAADAFCRSKLGPDPWMVAERMMTKLKAGHCAQIAVPAAPTHVLVRRALGSLLMNPGLRTYVPAIVRRLDRCSDADEPALEVLMQQLTQPQPQSTDLALWSWVLSNNIIQSEFNETPPLSSAQLAMMRESFVASRDVTELLGFNAGAWPTYPLDRHVGAWADTSIPLLFLQGGLDPATLLRKARVMQPRFTRPNQTWVELPTASHTTLASSPFINAANERRSCGTGLLMGFIERPTTPVDVSCVAKVLPLDFTLPRTDLNQALFGRDDAWE